VSPGGNSEAGETEGGGIPRQIGLLKMKKSKASPKKISSARARPKRKHRNQGRGLKY